MSGLRINGKMYKKGDAVVSKRMQVNDVFAAEMAVLVKVRDDLLKQGKLFGQTTILIGLKMRHLLMAMDEAGVSFWDAFSEYMKSPQFSRVAAERCMVVAERFEVLHGDVAERLVKVGSLKAAGKIFAKGPMQAIGGAETWKQLMLGMGMAAPDAKIGGNAVLRAWLAITHPECTAKEVAELSAEIRAEWDEYFAKVNTPGPEDELMLQVGLAKQFEKDLHGMMKRVSKGDFSKMSRPAMEFTVKLLNDLREMVLAELKKAVA